MLSYLRACASPYKEKIQLGGGLNEAFSYLQRKRTHKRSSFMASNCGILDRIYRFTTDQPAHPDDHLKHFSHRAAI